MHSTKHGCVIRRAENVVLVDFTRHPEPPAPRFPGAGALRERDTAEEESQFLRDPPKMATAI